MNAQTQLRLVRHMNKRASVIKSAMDTDTMLGVGSLIPGVGAGFSAASAGRNFMHGNWGRGMADVGFTAANLIPGGGLAAKAGIGVFKGIGKALPTIGKMFRGGMEASHGVAGMVPGVKAFRGSQVGKFVGNNTDKIQLGSGIGSFMAKDHSPMAMKDQQFDSLMDLGKNTKNFSSAIGDAVGATGDPRYITPPATPSLPAMFASN